MFCEKCGHKANEGAAFCQKCGTQLTNNAATNPQFINPTAYPQGNIPQKKGSKKIIAIVAVAVCVIVAVVIALSYGGGGSGVGRSPTSVQCSPCNGKGTINCSRCGGTGKLNDINSYDRATGLPHVK